MRPIVVPPLEHAIAGRRIRDGDQVVVPGRQHAPAVRCELDETHSVAVPAVHADRPSVARAPDAHRPVLASGRDEAAVGTDRNGRGTALVRREGVSEVRREQRLAQRCVGLWRPRRTIRLDRDE
jgi:hypothetical protein